MSMEKRKLEENEDEARKGTGSSPSETKRTRVIGPALPPGFGSTSDNEESKSKDESDGNESSDSDDDDDYGPTLPPTGAEAAQQQQDIALAASKSHEEEEGSKPLRRDDWMLKPPDSSDWSSRVDPTKIRNRKFNMGRSAPASKGPADTWTETAEEKKKRLAAELMGMRAPANQNNAGAAGEEISELDLQKKRQVEEYNVSILLPATINISVRTH